MKRRVWEFDWATTPLGPVAQWPVELRTVVDAILESHFPAAIAWGPELTTIYNDAFLPILGNKPEALGRSFAEIWAEAWDEIRPIAERAYAGEATFIRDFPLTLDRTGRMEPAWFTFCYSPLRLADGTVAGMMDTVVETTQTVLARRDLDVLSHELHHRLKNSLATVQTLVRQTLRDVPDREPVEDLLERIVALGTAHDVLFREGRSSATVEEIARETLSGLLDLGRIELGGPPVQLGPRAAVALALILHELATNAAKYGSLSGAEGRVSFTWALGQAGGLLRFLWEESSGPPAHAPARVGLGSRLIDMGLSPSGKVMRDYAGGGLRVAIEAPLDELMAG
jgi:two-component sensor histidine kinase